MAPVCDTVEPTYAVSIYEAGYELLQDHQTFWKATHMLIGLLN